MADETVPPAVERRIRPIEDTVLLLAHDLKGHLVSCERRGLRLERLAWGIGGIVVSILGIIIRAYFHFGGP